MADTAVPRAGQRASSLSARLPSVAGMRTRPDHREAVARRLELLRAERDPEGRVATEEEHWWEAVPVLELVPPAPAAEPRPPLVPVPGRHAARRPSSAVAWVVERVAGVLPETLRGRVGLGPWHLTLVALLAAGALALTCWWVVRGDPEVAPVASGTSAPLVGSDASPAAPDPAAPSAGSSGVPSAAGSAGAVGVTVDVTGRVRHPAVLDLPAGSRVVDAIRAAGGARPGADLSTLNRARLLVDGEQIVVGGPGSGAAGSAGSGAARSDVAGPGAAAGAAPAASGPAALVNLNTATLDELDGLPEVGPVTAQAILDYRTEHGGFGSVDELLDIEGIGEKTLAKLAPLVTV